MYVYSISRFPLTNWPMGYAIIGSDFRTANLLTVRRLNLIIRIDMAGKLDSILTSDQ